MTPAILTSPTPATAHSTAQAGASTQATAVDRYPTRLATAAAMQPRTDPVVYGDADSGPLGASQLLFYEDNGYLSLDRLLSEEDILAAQTELQRLRSSETTKQSPEAVIEPESRELRSVFAVHRSNEVLRRLCTHPSVVAIARQLLGGDVYIHQSRINYKSGYRGKEFYWHSDFETWHAEDGLPGMRTVSCSISLTPNTPYNGPLLIVPGSHQRFVPCVGATPEEHYKESLRRQEVGVPDDQSLLDLVSDFGIAAPTGLAGGVTFFDCNVMHGSNSNITPLPRSNVFVVFNSVDNTPVAPFAGTRPRPPFIAERQDFSPLTGAENL